MNVFIEMSGLFCSKPMSLCGVRKVHFLTDGKVANEKSDTVSDTTFTVIVCQLLTIGAHWCTGFLFCIHVSPLVDATWLLLGMMYDAY